MLLNCILLRVPWTARRSNQSILKEIIPGCSLEGLMLRLKLQYFGHLKERTDSTEKTLLLGGSDGAHHWHDGHEFEQAPGVGNGQGSLAYCGSWGRKESDTTEWLNWTELSLLRGWWSLTHLGERKHLSAVSSGLHGGEENNLTSPSSHSLPPKGVGKKPGKHLWSSESRTQTHWKTETYRTAGCASLHPSPPLRPIYSTYFYLVPHIQL